MKLKVVYVVAVTTHFDGEDRIEFKISQTAYDSFENAQRFCMSRTNSYQIDEYNFVSEEENTWHEYTIMSLTLECVYI